jgi:drug/metabolite transporter (DMT)-like permease
MLLSRSDLRQQSLVRSEFLVGNVVVLLACASSSFYNVYSKDLLKCFPVWKFGVRLRDGFGAEHLAPHLVRALTWVGYRLLHDRHLALGPGLECLRLGFSDGAVGVRAPPPGREPSFVLHLFVALLGVLISAVTLHERITGSMLIGGGITLAGAVMITAVENSPAAEEA